MVKFGKGERGGMEEESAGEYGEAMRVYRASRSRTLDLLDQSLSQAVRDGITGSVCIDVRLVRGRQIRVERRVLSQHLEEVLGGARDG